MLNLYPTFNAIGILKQAKKFDNYKININSSKLENKNTSFYKFRYLYIIKSFIKL